MMRKSTETMVERIARLAEANPRGVVCFDLIGHNTYEYGRVVDFGESFIEVEWADSPENLGKKAEYRQIPGCFAILNPATIVAANSISK